VIDERHADKGIIECAAKSFFAQARFGLLFLRSVMDLELGSRWRVASCRCMGAGSALTVRVTVSAANS
jgi:hypothetical protein